MPDIIDPVAYRAANASAKQQMAFQERMSNTAHQREVKDLIAAGLNPVLSSGGQGASTPTGAEGYVGDANAKLFDLLNQQLAAQNQLLSDVVSGSSASSGSGRGRRRSSAKSYYYNSSKSYEGKKPKEGYFFDDPDNIVDRFTEPLLTGKGNLTGRLMQGAINAGAYLIKHASISSSAGSRSGTSASNARRYQETTGKSSTLGGRVGDLLSKALTSAKKLWNAGKIKPAQGTKERMLAKRIG